MIIAQNIKLKNIFKKLNIHLYDTAEVHRLVADDFQVDDEVDEDEKEVGKQHWHFI